MPNFNVVGLIEPSNTRRSFKVYELFESKKVFIGLRNKNPSAPFSFTLEKTKLTLEELNR